MAQVNQWLLALVVSLALSIESSVAWPIDRPLHPTRDTTLVAGERWSPALEKSLIFFHLDMLTGTTVREQYLYQEILSQLLWAATFQDPSMELCEWRVLPEDVFGDYSLNVTHQNEARRVSCLRGAVSYLLQQTISEFDFLSARKELAERRARWTEPKLRDRSFDPWAAEVFGLRSVYQKGSPLHQIHSVEPNDFEAVAFAEFDQWLRRTRERKLITFAGKSLLLASLDLPIPDPMVLQRVVSLKSPRVPAGVVFFEGERVGIPALIMVSEDSNKDDNVGEPIRKRLACNTSEPARLGDGSAGDAITEAYCSGSYWHGDVWFFLAVRKSDSSSYQEFCRQVQALTRDADIAAVVRGSPEGAKGLYILLPRQCENQP